MPSEHEEINAAIAEFQRRTREMLHAQQQAYLAAVSSWREELGKNLPSWPQPNLHTLIPRPGEYAEAWYAFAVKLFADQNRFLDEISKTIAMRDKNE
jgi:hypothetical protein